MSNPELLLPATVAALIVLAAARARGRVVPSRPRPDAEDSAGAPPLTVTRPASRLARLTRRPRLSDDDVAAWCDDMARHLRSGASLAIAVRSAMPAPALAPVVAPISLALDRGDTLAAATGRVTHAGAGVGLALGVIRACADLGGPAAQPLDRTAATLRARAADLAERQVHSAQARLSAVVLTALPVAALTLLMATSEASRTAVAGPAGVLCLGVGATLNTIGWWWMRRIVGGTR